MPTVIDTARPFVGKVAVITGGTRGIGLATARLLAQQGASVALLSRKAEACAAVERQMREEGHACVAIPGHAASQEDLARLIDGALAAFGGIDILVANAATNPVFDPLTELTEASWAKVMDMNVGGPLRLARLGLPHVAARGGGAMVCISSVNAHVAFAGSGVYGVSKAALEQMVRQLAVEWGDRGVRVNAVAPGTTATDMIRALLDKPGFREKATGGSALQRIAEPEDIAGAVAFMASQAARHVTGQTLIVDGGLTITRI